MSHFLFRTPRLHILIAAFALLLALPRPGAAAETLLLRQPDIHGNRVVFVYAGDLWTVSAEGGSARKLTSDPGMELFPVFSPDGSQIAFSAQYSGTREIWVMPSKGGEPRQLSFYPDVGEMPPRGGWDTFPIDWTPDGKQILFRTNRTPYGRRMSRYFLVNVDGRGLEKALEIPEGGPASLSADGVRLAYSIKSREFRTWKRYKAGRAQDIYIYDLKAHTIDRTTRYPGTDSFPIWVGNTIYFISDRSSVDSDEPRRLNFFKTEVGSGSIQEVSHFTDFDCLWPHGGPDGIVFENGGALWILNPANDKLKRLRIEALDDRPHARPRWVDASKNIESFSLSPNGKRAIFGARGEIFTVPAKSGETHNLSNNPKTRERSVDWSPDGLFISYLSDIGGDYELYLKAYHSDEAPIRLTTTPDAWITGYEWSPDSSHIYITDTKQRLSIIDVTSHELSLVDTGKYSPLGSAAWSGNGSWLAYAKRDKNRLSSIWLYSLSDGAKHQATKGRYDAYGPTFDPEGAFLYFVARTDYEWENRNFKGQIYLATLRADIRSPFEAEEDEQSIEAEQPKTDATAKAKDADADQSKAPRLLIDLDRIAERVVALPVEAGNVYGLVGIEGGLLFQRQGDLKIFQIKDKKEKTVLQKVSGVVLTADGKKALCRSNSTWGIIDVKPEQKIGDAALDLSGLELLVDPKTEWPQIYLDAWRIMRDWFYDPGMHQVDWPLMRDRYAKLIPHLGSREDLDFVLGELIGELNSGHTYVHAPHSEHQVTRVDVGVLGCELEPSQGYYRISKIFDSRSTDAAKASPLRAPGLEVKEGEWIIAIDGRELKTDENPYRRLVNRAGHAVTLSINDRPEAEGAREIIVRPLASEFQLRHDDWVEHNRRIVDKLSGGRIGYIYVPDTSYDGFREFYQGWYEQSTKDALIIDDRYNGGGQIPSPMIFDMARPTLSYWGRRSLELSSTPITTNHGPKIMLINGRSSSGGDAFPAYFRKAKLGPLMGATTWGGLVGYSYSPSFVDGGNLAVPSFGFINTDGEWDVEYVGVKPDIEIFDDPTLIRLGREPMLEKAVEYLLDQLAKNPPKTVTKPEYPDRS